MKILRVILVIINSLITFSCITNYSILQASRNGDIEYLQKVLEKNERISARDAEMNTPLIIASLSGQNDVVKFLIDNGSDVNETNYGNYTPLSAALSYRRLDTAKILIDNGAILDIETHMLLVGFRLYEIIDYCLSKNIDLSLTLHIAASSDLNDMLLYLLDKGVNIDSRNASNSTSLMTSIDMQKFSNIKTLLSRGANPNAIDNNEKTPLMIACSKGNLDIIKLLIENGADINKQGFYDITPLMIAITFNKDNKNIEVIKYLLENGADVLLKDKQGKKAVDYAKAIGNDELVDLLK